jgi:nitrogen fixation NifU-like protein
MMDLYAENILDHYRNPRNFGSLKSCDYKAKDANPLCGDKLVMEIKVSGAGKISEAKFHGIGCAISQASASMLTEKLKGMTLAQAGKIGNDDIYKMLAVPISQSRVKCALLGLSTLKKALRGKKNASEARKKTPEASKKTARKSNK